MLNLVDLRKRAGLTQDELAERVGVTRQTLSSIEREKSMPSPTNAQAIAQVLNASIGEGAVDWKEFYE